MKKKKLNRCDRLFAFAFLLLPAALFCQGTLHGVVTDSLTHEKLVGINVFVEGTSLGGATNIEGEYKIAGIPERAVNIKVSCVGYETKELNADFSKSNDLQLDVVLSQTILQGKEVVITAQMRGQVAAINQQLTSNSIVNVVSEEKIKELPDANAAEAIGRLPGVSIIRSGGEANKVILRGLSEKFTNITIDGVQVPSTDSLDRSVDLSTISQSSLSGIELYKAETPDKDGDAIAGSINLVTKKAPSERIVRMETSGDYNELMNSAKQYNFALRYGERFFHDVLGVQLIGNLENRIRSSENIGLSYNQDLYNKTYTISDFNLQFNNEIRKRNGFSALLDFATPDEGAIRLNTVYSGTKRDILTASRDYPAYTGGSTTGSSVWYSARDQVGNINTLNTALLGDNKIFSGTSINWGTSFAQSSLDFPYDYLADFLEPSQINPKDSSTISGMKTTPAIKDHPEQLVPYAMNNFRVATLYDAFYYTRHNYDRQRVGYLNIAQEYTLSNVFSGQLKVGGKYRDQVKSNVQGRTYAPYYLGYWGPNETEPDGSVQKKVFSGTYFDQFYQYYLQSSANNDPSFIYFLDPQPDTREIFKLYDLNPITSRGRLEQWYSLNKNGIGPNGKEYTDDPTSKNYNYSITERTSAGYVMNTLNIGQALTLIAGVRVEAEDNDYRSRYSPIQTGGFPMPPDASRDTTASHRETVWLPNFHVNYKAADFFNVRVAAYRALARPDFNMRLNTYFAWRDYNAGGDKELFLGNPTLRDAKAWNYEVNLSFFGDRIGLFSVSAFYKDITDMFHVLNKLSTAGDTLIKYFGLQWKSLYGSTETYSLTVPYNSDQPTKVWGFELEHQMNFAFLPGFLQNFVLSYNASFVRSETHIIATTTDTSYVTTPGFPFPTPVYTDRPIDRTEQLENQPKFYGNIALGYDVGGFSGRISLFYQSEYNVSFDPSGYGNIVSNPFTRIDMALKQKIFSNISLVLNISNLTNVKESTSLYDRVDGYKVLNTQERYGITGDFGAIWEF